MRRVLLGILVFVALPLTTAAKCPPENQEPPKQTVTGIVEAKTAPCGKDGKCQPGEVTCHQLRLRLLNNNKVAYRCVEKAEWDKYKKGDKYP